MTEITVDGTKRQFDINDPQLPDWVRQDAFGSGNYAYEKKLKRARYEAELEVLQLELVKLQAHRAETGMRMIIVFEGRDAAGKGGTIGAFREYLKPRTTRVFALAAPTDVERDQWYYQRYIQHFPTSGELTIFDRSWYNRGGVEPVMGFCTPEQNKKFLEQTPAFEKTITDEGIALFKIWLNIGQQMQIRRFHDRRHNPMKSWKLSPIDLKALKKWDDYTNERNAMLKATHTEHAPWTIIRSNDKRRARLNAIRHVLNTLKYEGKDQDAIGQADPEILGHKPEFLNSYRV